MNSLQGSTCTPGAKARDDAPDLGGLWTTSMRIDERVPEFLRHPVARRCIGAAIRGVTVREAFASNRYTPLPLPGTTKSTSRPC
jgi:hypothetical protein